MMGGYSSDTVRWGMTPPARDAKGVSNPRAFGSAHQGGCNVSYADGMVRTVSFDIDPTVHAQLSCRDDGKGMPPK
jgi:prepilin-type processing-associated H-X9-DG protein